MLSAPLAAVDAIWKSCPKVQVQILLLKLSKLQLILFFCNKVSSQWEVPFFSYSLCFEKINCQLWQYFVSRTSCPKTKHSQKVEVAHVNISGMEYFQFSFGNNFSHMQFIVAILTQKHINTFSKDKLGPECSDFITAESFDWPQITFYQTSISHRISLANKCFHFVQKLGKNFCLMERFGLSWSYQVHPTSDSPLWCPSSGQGSGTAYLNSHHLIAQAYPCKTTCWSAGPHSHHKGQIY